MVTLGRLIGSTLMTMFTAMLTGPMVEWAFWWLGEKMVRSSDATWDDELFDRMKKEREASKKKEAEANG